MIDGFRERARGVDALLRDARSTFLIVTSPERAAAEEAIYMRARLRDTGMPVGGLIINRVHSDGLDGLRPEEVAALLSDRLGERLAGRVASNLAEVDALVQRDRASVARLATTLGEPEPILIPDLAVDVADIAGLVAIEEHLFDDS